MVDIHVVMWVDDFSIIWLIPFTYFFFYWARGLQAPAPLLTRIAFFAYHSNIHMTYICIIHIKLFLYNIIYHVHVPLQAALILKALLILLYLPLSGLKTFYNNFIRFNNIAIHFEFSNINTNTNLLMSILCFIYYYSWITYHKKM